MSRLGAGGRGGRVAKCDSLLQMERPAKMGRHVHAEKVVHLTDYDKCSTSLKLIFNNMTV